PLGKNTEPRGRVPGGRDDAAGIGAACSSHNGRGGEGDLLNTMEEPNVLPQPVEAAASRRWLVRTGLALLIAVIALQGKRLLEPAGLGVADFVEYWSAARLNVTGGNPYSLAQLLPVQQSAGWDEEEAIPMW